MNVRWGVAEVAVEAGDLFEVEPVIQAHAGWVARDGWGNADLDRVGFRLAVLRDQGEGAYWAYAGAAFFLGRTEAIT